MTQTDEIYDIAANGFKEKEACLRALAVLSMKKALWQYCTRIEIR